MFTDIRIQNFRSYSDASFELGPKVNIIVGPNASGKTNLLEAILILCIGKSYRARDLDLLQRNMTWARIDAHTPTGQRSLKIEQQGENAQKQLLVNGNVTKRFVSKTSLPVVLFEPNNLRLLSAEPALRRNMLDDLLDQTSLSMSQTRTSYARLVAQRNALLKKGLIVAKPQIFAWNLRLSELASMVVNARVELITQINNLISEIYSDLSGHKSILKISYVSPFNPKNYASEILKKLENNIELDVLRGFTAYGPHREDIEITINGQLMSKTASRGEIRTLLLCIKLIELKLLEESRNQPPILLLDDVFSELDGRRRKALTLALDKYQTFITTTDADVVVRQFIQNCNIIALG